MKCSQCDKDSIINLGTESHPNLYCEKHARAAISHRKDALYAHYIQETGHLDWLLSQALKRWCRCEQLPHTERMEL